MEKNIISKIVSEALNDATPLTQTIPVLVEVSGRHLHLSAEDYANLFGDRTPQKIRELSQPGQYLSDIKVSLVGPKGRMEKVALLLPFRSKTQIEISVSDSVLLGVNPPINISGDLTYASTLHIMAENKLITLEQSAIIAKRHLHINTSDIFRFGLEEAKTVDVLVNTQRPTIYKDVIIRGDQNASLALHIDRDEGNAAGLISSCEGFIILNPQNNIKANLLQLRGEKNAPVLITEDDIIKAYSNRITTIEIYGKALITPLAQDLIRAYSISIKNI